MSTHKSRTAQANGAKSAGPATPEGRAKSAQNSLQHGLTAKQIVLSTESEEEFEHLRDGFIAQFQPHGLVESELVETMAVARWRLRRLMIIESKLLNTELVLRAEEIDEEFEVITDGGRNAFVFRKLANSGMSLPLVLRYEGSISRTFDRAFKQLANLQASRLQRGPNQPESPPRSPSNENNETNPGAREPDTGGASGPGLMPARPSQEPLSSIAYNGERHSARDIHWNRTICICCSANTGAIQNSVRSRNPSSAPSWTAAMPRS
jgi:hypothetical protein